MYMYPLIVKARHTLHVVHVIVKARHLHVYVALHFAGARLSEQAMGWLPIRSGIGTRR